MKNASPNPQPCVIPTSAATRDLLFLSLAALFPVGQVKHTGILTQTN
jgi:hypothetical protein